MALVVCEVISHLKAVPSNPCQGIVHGSPRGLRQAGCGRGGECCCRCGWAGPSSSWQWRGARTFFPGDSEVFQRVFHSLYCTHMHTHPWPAGRPSDAFNGIGPTLVTCCSKNRERDNKILVSILYLSLRGLRLCPLEADLK